MGKTNKITTKKRTNKTKKQRKKYFQIGNGIEIKQRTDNNDGYIMTLSHINKYNKIQEDVINMAMSQFPMSDENINNFHTMIDPKLSSMDCFINAMQLIGVFDDFISNVLRLTYVGSYGVEKEQVEKIFMYYNIHNMKNIHMKKQLISRSNKKEEIPLTPYYEFREDLDYDTFTKNIREKLVKGYVILAGYEITTPTGMKSKHIFLIGRNLDDRILFLDPQKNMICDLTQNECLKNITGSIEDDKKYCILYQSKEYILSDSELLKEIGFNIM